MYGIDGREDVAYIIDTLLGGAPHEGGADTGRAGQLALAAYDRMTEADAAGAEYESRVFPPPGHGPRRQPS